MKFNPTKYVQNKAYREAVDAALIVLSENLKIPFGELYNGLFFSKGSEAN